MIIFSDKIFTNPIKVIQAFNRKELEDAFSLIEKLRHKFFLTGYIRYEAFNVQNCDLPLLYFEVFENYDIYKPQKPKNLLLKPTPCVNFCEYSNVIKQIKEEIACGNTYEVNYTYDFEVPYNGDDFELFESLLNKQKTPYNFYLKNKYDTVLSFSPELFFTIKNDHITTKPMKGTIKRGKDSAEDVELINYLRNDEKNRAENVMIVDLLRNDLGKIAKTGTVKVTKLFDIETHKTLHQMTSQIEADLKDNTTLFDIFKAIFPCGSITGAPKLSTMKIIKRLEQGERNIYCGAIGMISPTETVFSVPIRILQKCGNDKNFKYRAGGAIVLDSDIQDEWEETLTKTKFLNDEFQIIETIKVENGKPVFENEHFKRMENCAKHFGFKFTKPEIMPEKKYEIIRLLLSKDGTITKEYKPLLPVTTRKISISPIKVNSSNEFLYYKTTYRPWFFECSQKIANGEIFDEIFFNEKDELTEGSRSNVILQINGKLFTPPVKCGLLDGIFKQSMKNLTEKVLYKKDIEKAEKIYCVNSVRGIIEVDVKKTVGLKILNSKFDDFPNPLWESVRVRGINFVTIWQFLIRKILYINT